MKCNTCWRNLEGRAVATNCGHVFCMEDATKILSSDSTCPLCERILSKSDMKAIDMCPKDDWVNMAMAGVPPDSIMKSAFKGVVFWIGQKDVEAQVTVTKAMQLREKFEEMQTKYMEKLQQVHSAYQKAMKKLQALEEEKESILKDKNELQEKYSEKSRQKRKLEEMYEVLRGEYEKVKRTAISGPTQPSRQAALTQKNQYQFTDRPTISGFENPNVHVRQDSAMRFDIAPITPAAHDAQLWPARQKAGSSLFDLPGRPAPRSARNFMAGNAKGGGSPFANSDPSMFTIGPGDGNITSNGIRNLLLSPIKTPTSRLPPSGFR
ncbi:unnamed protein product [Calypogeia fissa]